MRPPRPRIRPEIVARNKTLAAEQGVELDSLGRLKSSPQQGDEEELQYHHNPETGEVTEVWRRVPRDEVRCKARITSPHSEWRGNQCTKPRNKGMTVCSFHGGNLPNVKKAAARRLMLAAEPAAEKLVWIALYKGDVADKDRIKAIIEILDRAGVAGKTTVELEIKPWQQILQRVYGQLPDGSTGEILEAEEGVDYIVEDEDADVA